jgi:hypothetical protein
LGNPTKLHIRLLKIASEGFVWSTQKNRFPDKEIPGMLIASIGSYRDFRDVDRDLIGVCLNDLMRNKLIQHWRIKEVTERIPDDSFFCKGEWTNRNGARIPAKHGPAIKVHAKEGLLLLRTSHFGQGLYYFISDSNL